MKCSYIYIYMSSINFHGSLFNKVTEVNILSQFGRFQIELIRYHYDDVIMSAMASQITSLTIVYSTVYSGGDQRKHQCSASLAFVWGIHRGPVNSPHKWPVMRKMFPFDDVIMNKKNAAKALLHFKPDSSSWKLAYFPITASHGITFTWLRHLNLNGLKYFLEIIDDIPLHLW